MKMRGAQTLGIHFLVRYHDQKREGRIFLLIIKVSSVVPNIVVHRRLSDLRRLDGNLRGYQVQSPASNLLHGCHELWRGGAVVIVTEFVLNLLKKHWK